MGGQTHSGDYFNLFFFLLASKRFFEWRVSPEVDDEDDDLSSPPFWWLFAKVPPSLAMNPSFSSSSSSSSSSVLVCRLWLLSQQQQQQQQQTSCVFKVCTSLSLYFTWRTSNWILFPIWSVGWSVCRLACVFTPTATRATYFNNRLPPLLHCHCCGCLGWVAGSAEFRHRFKYSKDDDDDGADVAFSSWKRKKERKKKEAKPFFCTVQ